MKTRKQIGRFAGLLAIGICSAALALVSSFHHEQGQARAPGSIVAFSMKAAEHILRSRNDADKEVNCLAGVTRLIGMVHDVTSNDLVLVGVVDPDAPPLSLSDLVVALRSVCQKHAWPAVSIDRTNETRKTGFQAVRLEAGIEGSDFGQQMVAADVALKKIALGLLPVKNIGPSYFTRSVLAAGKPEGSRHIGSRFWFVPLHQAMAQRQDVFVITDLQIGVQTQVLSVDGKPVHGATSVQDSIGNAFSRSLTEHYAALGSLFPEIGRLKSLLDLTAVAHGIESVKTSNSKPDLTFWLNEYKVPRRMTLQKFPLLSNSAPVRIGGRHFSMEINGGIQLKALILRLHKGDVTALRDIVLKSRPQANALSWVVPAADWRLPGMRPIRSVDAASTRTLNNLGASVTRRLVPEGQSGKVQDEPPAPELPAPKPSIAVSDRVSDPSERTLKNGAPSNSSMYYSNDGGKTNYLKKDAHSSLFDSTNTDEGSLSGVYFGSAIKKSQDGRLKAVFQWKNGDDIHERAIGYWEVYDNANNGKSIGTFENQIELLNNGKVKALTQFGQMKVLSIGMEGRDIGYTTYNADDLYKKKYGTNSAALPSPESVHSAAAPPNNSLSPKRGGVLISPVPVRNGGIGAQEPSKVLRSRPSQGSLSWSIPLGGR
jgi:hypothetical protein